MTLDEDQPQSENTLDAETQNEEFSEQADQASVENEDDVEQKPEPVTFDANQQKVFDDAIGKKVGQTKAAERDNVDLRRQLDEANAKLPIETRAVVPDLPDPYADNYADLIAVRDEKIRSGAAFDARQEAEKTQRVNQEQQTQQQQQNEVVKVVSVYADRAQKLGITAEELKTSGNVVAGHGLHNEVTMFILQDENGPAITQYLAQHPQILDGLTSMTPMQAAAHIESKVKPAVASSNKSSKAPAPATSFEGGGSPPTDRGPKGATFV